MGEASDLEEERIMHERFVLDEVRTRAQVVRETWAEPTTHLSLIPSHEAPRSAASFTTETPDPPLPDTAIPPPEEPETSTHTMVLDNARGNAPLDTWTSDIYSGTRGELEAILLY